MGSLGRLTLFCCPRHSYRPSSLHSSPTPTLLTDDQVGARMGGDREAEVTPSVEGFLWQAEGEWGRGGLWVGAAPAGASSQTGPTP